MRNNGYVSNSPVVNCLNFTFSYLSYRNSNSKNNNDDDDDDDNNNNNNNNNNDNNNLPESKKYWVDVQQGIASSHGERDPP